MLHRASRAILVATGACVATVSADFIPLTQERCVESGFSWHSGSNTGGGSLDECATAFELFEGELNAPAGGLHQFSHESEINGETPGLRASCSIWAQGFGNDFAHFWTNTISGFRVTAFAEEPMDLTVRLLSRRTGNAISKMVVTNRFWMVDGQNQALLVDMPFTTASEPHVITRTHLTGHLEFELDAQVWVYSVNFSSPVALVTYELTLVPHAFPAGDMNCDDIVSLADIGGFMRAVTNPGAYDFIYPDCNHLNADINGDGFATVNDIGPFVQLLTGG